jgi:hypothetical protein
VLIGRKKLLQQGERAEGVVVGRRLTVGSVAGQAPDTRNYYLRIRVRFDDGSTHEWDTLDEALGGTTCNVDEIGEYNPGDVVPVRYDPSDRSKAVLDYPVLKERYQARLANDKANETARIDETFARLDGPQTTDEPGGSPGLQESAADILARGEPAQVVVVEAGPWDPPMTAPNGDPVWQFVLTVTRGEGDPYRVTVGNRMPARALALVYPGAKLPAKILPPSSSPAIDWDTALKEAGG